VDAEFQLFLDNTLSESALEKQFTGIVQQIKQQAKEADEAILGRTVDVTAVVLAPLSVELDFLITDDVLNYIAEQLAMHSPVGSEKDKHPGQYAASNKLLADGILVSDLSHPTQAKEYIFVNELPYAEKIEKGESSQAPSGVYEVTANEAQKRFLSAKIEFIDYVDSSGSFPAIRVTL
jgi:hypothetical protein